MVIPDVNEDEYRDRCDGDGSGEDPDGRELEGDDGRWRGDMAPERGRWMNEGRGGRCGEGIRRRETDKRRETPDCENRGR